MDLSRWLLNDEVDEIYAMSNNISFPAYPESDLNVVLMRFKSGVIAKIIIAFGAARPQDHSIRIYGTEACIENNLLFNIDGDYKVIMRQHLPHEEYKFIKKRSLLSIHGHGIKRKTKLYLGYLLSIFIEGIMKLYNLLFKGDLHYQISSYPIKLYPHSQAVKESLGNFIRSIQGFEEIGCTVEDAAKTVSTCVAGVESYRTNKVVKIKY